MNLAARIVFRYRLAQRFQLLPSLWFENEAGERWIPDFSTGDGHVPPPGYIYQHDRMPASLRHSILRTILPEEVATCPHPEEDLRKTYGWVEGVEGRECARCKGTQVRNIGEPWPDKWDSSGSYTLLSGESTWPTDLALAMARPSSQEVQEAALRHGKVLRPLSVEDSILVAATACEACMNSLAHHYGLGWGYERGSKDWKESGTSCELCETPDFWNWINTGEGSPSSTQNLKELAAATRELKARLERRQ